MPARGARRDDLGIRPSSSRRRDARRRCSTVEPVYAQRRWRRSSRTTPRRGDPPFDGWSWACSPRRRFSRWVGTCRPRARARAASFRSRVATNRRERSSWDCSSEQIVRRGGSTFASAGNSRRAGRCRVTEPRSMHRPITSSRRSARWAGCITAEPSTVPSRRTVRTARRLLCRVRRPRRRVRVPRPGSGSSPDH